MRLEVVGGGLARGHVALLRRLARRLGEELGRPRDRVTLLLTDDRGIRALNRRFLGKDRPTDVLSFPSGEEDATSGSGLGDLAISVQRAKAQAAELGHGLGDELEVLLLHGVLHLLGHDHERDGGRMRRLEARLRRRLGLEAGLIERAG